MGRIPGRYRPGPMGGPHARGNARQPRSGRRGQHERQHPGRLETVGPYLPHAPDTPVLVIGGYGSSVCFYSIAIALALGASSVAYVDHDEARLAKAESLGASIVPSLDAIPSRNYPVTVCSAPSQLALTSALRATEPDGTCVCNAIFFEGAVALPMLDMYVRGVRLVTGRVNARAV